MSAQSLAGGDVPGGAIATSTGLSHATAEDKSMPARSSAGVGVPGGAVTNSTAPSPPLIKGRSGIFIASFIVVACAAVDVNSERKGMNDNL